MKKTITILSVILLSACGTTEVIKRADSNYSVSAQFGALNGSWNRATTEAVAKAEQFCNAMGQKYIFLNEKRDGVPGWSPQVSEITFQCGQDTNALIKTEQEVCAKEMQTSELDAIREKVELFRENDSPVPFQIASNQNFPTTVERNAIEKWAKIREACNSRYYSIIANAKQVGNQLQRNHSQQDLSYSKQLTASVSELVLALYQQKLTYGEFAQKRYEISQAIGNARREFRASVLTADRDAQARANQLVEQQMQNNLMLWSTYMQSVNARQPLKANCVTQKMGSTITTNCN
jgi:hypothetical protein